MIHVVTPENQAEYASDMEQVWRLRHRVATAMALIGVGLVCRLVPLGLPGFALKYGGSFLWGAMVHCIVVSLLARRGFRTVAMAAAVIAVATELLRLYDQPWLDAFRLTLPDAFLLGRIFSPWNLVAYGVGIGTAALCDGLMGRRNTMAAADHPGSTPLRSTPLDQGQLDLEHGAGRSVHQLDRSAMRPQQRALDAEPHARAAVLAAGREERLEHPSAVTLGDAATVAADADPQDPARRRGRQATRPRSPAPALPSPDIAVG